MEGIMKGGIFVLFVLLSVVYSEKVLEYPKLSVSIYYEALCQDSANFIKDQFMPAYNLIGSYLDVTLIPYGKARHWYGDGNWIFSCHHGEKECRANEVQGCALVGRHNNQTAKVNFVYCAMMLIDPSSDRKLKQCANDCGMSWGKIRSCANSRLGDEVMLDNAIKTQTQKLKVVPTIIFNGQYNEQDQAMALHDFTATACSKLHPVPNICPDTRQVYWYKK